METMYPPKAAAEVLPELAAFLAPFASLLHNAQSRRTLHRYLTGLLSDLPRKNCETIAATVAGTSIERLQHPLTDAQWAPETLSEARVRWLIQTNQAPRTRPRRNYQSSTRGDAGRAAQRWAVV